MWRRMQQVVLGILLLGLTGAGGCFAVVQAQGGKLLSVQTGSMTPHIHKGDLVVVTRVPAGQLVVGDVITYISPRQSRTTITHRIVRIHGSEIITKGDANPAADAPISTRAVVGKVTHHVRYAGRGLDFVRKPLGLALLIYVPALAVVISEVRRLSEHYRKQQPYFAPGVEARLRPYLHAARAKRKAPLAAQLSAVLVLAAAALIAPSVHAALHSNSVALTGNTINAVVRRCTGSSNTSINISSTTNQTAGTGSVSGPNATSGSASNSNSTSINITGNNCP
jgi:signal peptidase I